MTTILVIYHSQSGNTECMAEAVALGASMVEGVTVVLRRASDATLNDLEFCDGLAIGSPEYFGYMAGMIKDFFDRTYEKARTLKEIIHKPYVVFVSAGNDGTGAVTQIERIALGYPLKKVHDPVIAKGPITPDIALACQTLGQTLAAGCEASIY